MSRQRLGVRRCRAAFFFGSNGGPFSGVWPHRRLFETFWERFAACSKAALGIWWALMITVETTETAVLVTIPKSEVPADRLNSFLDWLRLEAVARRSSLTEDEAERMAEKLKADWWAANKGRFIKAGQ